MSVLSAVHFEQSAVVVGRESANGNRAATSLRLRVDRELPSSESYSVLTVRDLENSQLNFAL